ncbi:N-methyltryptophan oxidase [Microbacterium sorbitolivorans]|uniref:FAD-dependent oxidoreductase n=1 Tax=Microbacterium sorbitolivorans TaxID=1867410 RepID=A0A367XZ68_9MICO|nr:FAD-dependent oxidoreductase [Microbacterium sorbitolivorans]RCK58699.1 FAD-dependent oxidoreductase [Microbacterium sorbitolivorans]GGF38661.1 N-methyltryptophan oxidase [Microbacterium sorbitolivorans]
MVASSQRTAESATYAVVGAGLAGSSVAWRLAQQGESVVLLERDVPASALGSSHGSARIFRYAYPDPFYVGLVADARRSWDELEAVAGKRLITPSGSLDFGSIRNPRGLAGGLETHGIEHELLSQEEAGSRWSQLSFDGEVLWHPGAGVIDAEGSVEAMVELAAASGAVVKTGWEVASIRRASSGYVVTSSTGEAVHAEQVIIAAGGWLPSLLADTDVSDAFAIPELEVMQENAYHFPYLSAADRGETPAGAATSWPTFIYKGERIQVYGLPGGRDADFAGQKVAEYMGGKRIASAYAQDGIIDPANRVRVTDFVREFTPGLEAASYAETTCLFTNVPRDDMIIDRAEGITIISPCSGQGAKFAPLFGELVYDLVAGSGIAGDRFRATGQRFERIPA